MRNVTGNATETTQCAPSRPSLGIKGLLLIGVGLLASGWMGWVTLRGQAAHADRPVVAGEWLKVERGDFEVVCREDGELKPVKVTTIGFTDWGRVAWLIPEGSRVAKGDKIVSIETDRLEDDIQQIQDDLATAERNLAQLEQTQELDRKQWETTMLAEKDRLELARLKEKQILDKPDELDKKDADNKLKGAQARVAAAKADFEALTPLVERGFANRADVEAKELALKLAECELQRATLEVQDILDGATSEERRKAALDRTNAEAAFRLKELDRDQQLVNNAFQVRGSQHQVEQLQQRLARRKKNLEDSTRMAPHEGIVVYRTVGWDGNKKVSIGDHVGPWMSPVDLPSYDKMKVRTQVPESVVRYLHARSEGEGGKAVAGSEARVRVKTLPGKIYPAEVTWIDGWARDRNAKLSEADIKNKGLSGVRVFDVEVELKASDPERLRDGFRAMVEFPLETLTSVIAIPAHAVKTTGTQATVQVNTKGAPEIRPVTLGKESNGRIVILTGLSEGEKVLVPPMPAEVEEDASAAAMGTGTGPAAGKDGGGVSAPGGGGARTPGGAGGPGGGGMRSGGASGGGGGGSSGGRKGRSK